MEQNQYDLLEVLSHIEPAGLDYQQWVNVGMALEIEGYGVEVWEAWSRKDRQVSSWGMPEEMGRLPWLCVSCHRRDDHTVCKGTGVDAAL